MTRKSLREHLRDYYAGKHLAADKTARLAAMVPRGDTWALGSAQRAWPGWLVYGLAACVAVLLVGNVYFVFQSQSRARQLEDLRAQLVAGTQGETLPTRSPIPRFIAVNAFSGGCSYCKQIAPVFAELTEKYEDEPVLFIACDVSDTHTRRQTHALARSLGLDWLADELNRCCTVEFIDREQRKVLATLNGPDDKPQLEHAFDRALLARHP